MDSSEPSTNGISASNLYRLSSCLNDEGYAQRARETVSGFESEILQYPWLFASFMPSIVARNLGVKGIVVSGEDARIQDISKQRRGLCTIVKLDGATTWLRERNPLLKGIGLDGKTRVLICEHGACREQEPSSSLRLTEEPLDDSQMHMALPTLENEVVPGTHIPTRNRPHALQDENTRSL